MSSKILNRSLLFVAGFLFQSHANAQLVVSENTNVLVNNEVVYVQKDIELNAASSNFYLRKDAQLLQGSELQRSEPQSKNKGLGNLSVFQEGSTNNFQYNYWCSPVGGNIATAGNSPFGITQLKDITDLTTSNAPTILAANNYNGTASPFAIAPYWINKLVATGGYSDLISVGSSSNLNS